MEQRILDGRLTPAQAVEIVLASYDGDGADRC